MIAFNQTLAALKPWVDSLPQGLFDIEIKNICFDSREVTSGDAFFVLPSVAGNEQSYVDTAIKNGAIAVFCSEQLSGYISKDKIAVIEVDSPMVTAGSVLSHCLYNGALALDVIGITGTNGKSSISFYLAQILNALKNPCAVMGTVGYGDWDKLKPTGMTTLPLEALHLALKELNERFQTVAMEVSSHGLDQNRLAGVSFAGAVFSNLSRDHLDYHQTMEAYGEAKALLFTRSELKFAVINADDALAQTLISKCTVKPVLYGCENQADLKYKVLSMQPKGMVVEFIWQGQSEMVSLPLFGQFNVQNVAAAILCCLQMGFVFSAILQACEFLHPVPGRMQQVNPFDYQPLVLVDYAHTPDALEQILNAVKQHTTGRLIVVVGCGGDRDAGKRPLMGKIALQLADHAVITSDNPRSENPEHICKQMIEGMKGDFVVEIDRAAAIKQAISVANADDIVVIAGKGHEDYQEINGQRRHFSDVEEAKKALQLGNRA